MHIYQGAQGVHGENWNFIHKEEIIFFCFYFFQIPHRLLYWNPEKNLKGGLIRIFFKQKTKKFSLKLCTFLDVFDP